MLRNLPKLALPALTFVLLCGFRCGPEVPIGQDEDGGAGADAGALACVGDNPAGCTSDDECAGDEVCVTGTHASACSCDSSTGTWQCTADLGGGACEVATCPGENPAGCLSDAECSGDDVCVTGTHSSACSCDPTTRAWQCTSDLSGGECQPATCSSPDPTGCFDDSECDAGQSCVGSGRPSSCTCDPAADVWSCTRDGLAGYCLPDTCPDPSDPMVTYYGTNTAECAAVLFDCEPGERVFGGECGCGCEPDPGPDCGDERCDYTAEYCEVFTGGAPGSPTTYACQDLPAACAAAPSCAACFPSGPGTCEDTGEGIRYSIAAP